MKEKYTLFYYLNKYKWKYIAGTIVLLIVDVLNLYIPQFTGEITDGLQSHSMGMSGVIEVIGKILLVGFILAIGRFWWRYFIFGSARAIEYEIRNDMFAHLETLSMRYFNANKTGELMSYFTNDLSAVRMSIGPAVITAFDAIILTILVLAKMITHVDLELTLMAVIPMAIIAIGGIWYGNQAELRFREKQQAFSDLTDQVQESISGIRVIKAFVQERSEIRAFAKANKNNKDKNMRVVKLQATVIPLLDVVIGFSSLITLCYGGYLTAIGEITLGRFIAFNQYINMLVWPMMAIGDSITYFSQGKASYKRIQNVFHEQSEIVDEITMEQWKKTCESREDTMYSLELGKGGEALATPQETSIDIRGQIEFHHLTFTYNEQEKQVLEDINLTIDQGSTLAILGRTGSGKTTLANLLLRLYNTEHNMITIDGIDIRQIPLKVLREGIAYVPQDNFLFSDTLGNNIAFGSQQKDLATIEEAAKQACIHDNIVDFPEQYDTIVGERGVTLSGGQKQRSSIARALMKEAPILILDDALSAVDTDTEEKILKNLKANRYGKTTIIIAHRISTIQNADRILVLEEGKMAEYGTHDTLLAKNGIYADLYRKQQLERQLVAEE